MGEEEVVALELRCEQLLQPGLEERGLGSAQRVDLARVDVVAHDPVAECGHAGRVHGAEVAEADDADG